MDIELLQQTARRMVAPGRGVLAADESHPTIGKRFAALGIDSSEDSRRVYRQMFFQSPGIEEFISGVILFDETIRQCDDQGTPFPKLLASKDIIAGIKVDRGAKPLPGHPGETVTEGLDGLRDRLTEYFELGARFAKWRAVISIGNGMPSRASIETDAHALARYAALCQEASIVPIVEPEVLMDGDHDIETCEKVTTDVLQQTFSHLSAQGVMLEGIVLKPSMVIHGTTATAASTDEVAQRTLRCLQRTVPSAVPGIAFLSGGQSDEDATAHLDAMNRRGPHPWNLTFSYGRALQALAMRTWGGQPDAIERGAQAFLKRARCNSAATRGSWESSMEQTTA
ncbi:MAG: fructose-bisphosphate aldolase class I [Planctomycetota bacterium]|nr:fructose-bisphosphate aldolase class I [Planctomycetota bacterium]